ncbi:hypothetical protein EZJ43_09680 [Pedobacter changchengzhani]|uniref:Uncharacterized protein n=1 Tax=Pedobacter changchengzhani TaxID=2529274 RepID=A0A4V3A049_9SPHI|nr:hypothetical protein [Pedobacter changchengzhani]TDG36263.1 hypothetical protein EZJ43_09680 [Pedobacter changchengzhani]
MAGASLVFWLVCGLPLIGVLYWLIRKDKNKFAGIWGIVILGALIVGGFLAIIYITKDFNAVFSQDPTK